VSVQHATRRVHRAPRPRLRRGPEPRRAAPRPDAPGPRPAAERQAAQRPLLRRAAAGRAHRDRRDSEPGGPMSTTQTPPPKTNRVGLEVISYRGSKTTLCAGCGHNSISERLIECFFEMGIEPWRVAKFSGIGCSSKSPAYFLGLSHGFNGVHGRAPAIATGAMLANKSLLGIVVTGDGDTASIGIGQYIHLLRRNLPLIYVIENNGVYGLTKGQFSATSDAGAKSKSGVVNELQPVDCCVEAIQIG